MIEITKETEDYLRAKKAVMQSSHCGDLLKVLDYEINQMDKTWHTAEDSDLPKLKMRKQAIINLRNGLDPELQDKIGRMGEQQNE